jgi:hypothetical protein
MAHTKEERREYWRGRIMSKLKTMVYQINQDFVDLGYTIDHTNLDNKKIRLAIGNIMGGFSDLADAVKTAKERKIV